MPKQPVLSSKRTTGSSVGELESTSTHEHHGGEAFTKLSVARLTISAIAIVVVWSGYGFLGTGFQIIGVTVALTCGLPIVVDAVRALFRGRMTMELSMSIALLAALAVSEVLTALVIVLFVQLAEEIEKLTMERGRRSIGSLLSLLPAAAEVQDRTSREIKTIPVGSLSIGSIVVVRPGARLPVDGTVISGRSFVDESAITGEPMPAEKRDGSRVYAGSMNGSGALRVSAEKVGEDTSFGKIIAAVECSERSRAPVQKLADRLAAYLVYFGMSASFATYLFTGDIQQTISVIIVTGACGLAAGTPLAVLGAIGRAAHKGSIIKGGAHLEQLSRVDTIVFDKTGTLTVGRPRVSAIRPVEGVSALEVLRCAASAELNSEHPFGRSIVEAAKSEGIDLAEADSFMIVPGQGVTAQIDRSEVLVGSRKMLAARGVDLSRLSAESSTEAIVSKSGVLLGTIEVSDVVRADSALAVNRLQRMGIRVLMLTGDSSRTASEVAGLLCIESFEGGLSPEGKRDRIRELKEQGRIVAMVGDGINDAPALTEAHVGIAIGSGTDVAVESADVVLTGSELAKLVETVELSRRWRRVVLANFIGTIAVDTAGIALAFAGALSPLFAAFIHVGSEVVFLLNSMSLFPFSRKQSSGTGSGVKKQKIRS